MKKLTMSIHLSTALLAMLLSTTACSDSDSLTQSTSDNQQPKVTSSAKKVDSNQNNSLNKTTITNQNNNLKPNFTTKAIASFNEPWAAAALPSKGNSPLKLLVTQKSGELFIVNTVTGNKVQVKGVPKVAYGGQGGLGDIILTPDFATTQKIYLSYIEEGVGPDSNTFGAKVVIAKLSGLRTNKPNLQALAPIWQQFPKVEGQGHYSHRLLLSPDKRHLYISSGERQKKDPAQDMSVNLGKIIRLNLDGSLPADNPYASNNDISSQFWSMGHRNVLGMAFDKTGKLWAHEMGPRGGDELNLIEKGNNYGWPLVSNGRNYSGTDIPDHDTRPEFTAPRVSWTPVISPSSLSIYKSGTHNDFPAWQDKALISGLSSEALVVVEFDKDNHAFELYRYDMGARIRSVLVVDGRVLLLEDGSDGRLLHLQTK